MKLVVAIHGILTGQSDASWPDKFNAWCFHKLPSVSVLKKEYRAGPFPRWNVWIKDPIIARSLANEIREFCVDGCGDVVDKCPEIWFVAHSNGCVISLMTIKRLVKIGIPVAGLIFTGGACSSIVEDNGIWRWVDDGNVGKAVSFSSREDRVVKSKLIWPYGRLGHTGWQCRLESGLLTEWVRSGKAWTEWHPGYGHSGYFKPENIQNTFIKIRDIIQ